MEVESGVRIWVSDGETMRDFTARDSGIGDFEIAYNLYVVARAHATDGGDGAEMLAHALSLCNLERRDDESWSGNKAWNSLCDAVKAAQTWRELEETEPEAPDAK